MQLRRPSPALIISLISLMVALGGVGYAAVKLQKNSVGTKQVKKNAITMAKIKNDAVTGAKVKAGSLTGADIDLNSLGTVPSANTANTANALAAAEPTHVVGTAGEPGFLNESQSYPAPGVNLGPVGFYKDRAGFVHLEGIAKPAGGTPVLGATSIFQLPPGFRPATGITQIYGGGTNGIVIFGSGVTLEGKVLDGIVGGSKEQAAVLNGVVFRPGS